jgi:hypothetical protein
MSEDFERAYSIIRDLPKDTELQPTNEEKLQVIYVDIP